MCLGVGALLSAGLGIAGSMMSYQAASEQADAQNQFYMQNAEASNKAARAAYANQYTELVDRRNAGTQDKTERAIAALKARGTVREAAGSAGVTGLSVDALVGDYYAQQGRANDAIDENYQMTHDNIMSQMDAIHAQTTGRINSVQRAVPPSPGAFIVRGLTSAVNSFSTSMRGTSYMPTYNYSLGIG